MWNKPLTSLRSVPHGGGLGSRSPTIHLVCALKLALILAFSPGEKEPAVRAAAV